MKKKDVSDTSLRQLYPKLITDTHTPHPQAPVDDICNPVEVRRCRFIETVPPTPPDEPPGLGPVPRPKPDNSELECERGRVVEEASLGNAFAPFRAVPLGVPDARLRFLITSVLSDKGRTTP